MGARSSTSRALTSRVPVSAPDAACPPDIMGGLHLRVLAEGDLAAHQAERGGDLVDRGARSCACVVEAGVAAGGAGGELADGGGDLDSGHGVVPGVVEGELQLAVEVGRGAVGVVLGGDERVHVCLPVVVDRHIFPIWRNWPKGIRHTTTPPGCPGGG